MRYVLVVVLAALTVTSFAQPSRAAAAGGDSCSRAVAQTYARLVRADLRLLWSCVTAIHRDGGDAAEPRCAPLRTAGIGADRVTSGELRRLRMRCRDWPQWLPPPSCDGLDNASDRERLESCAVHAAHCIAMRAVADALGDDATATLAAQHPGNLELDLGGIAGNRFSACLAPPASTTTTTTTLPLPPTTHPAPTTTTTTIPPTTTTLPPPTTTLLAPTTTTTTTLPPTTTLPESLPRLLLTEIASNPEALSDAAGEYFEVRNIGAAPLDLAGLVVRDNGSDSFTVGGSLIVEPGEHVVFGRSASAAAGQVDYVYGSGMSLTNTSDAIVLVHDSEVLDAVSYLTGFPLVAGASMSLRPGIADAAGNDAASAWCRETAPLGNGDFGSPGRQTTACAP